MGGQKINFKIKKFLICQKTSTYQVRDNQNIQGFDLIRAVWLYSLPAVFSDLNQVDPEPKNQVFFFSSHSAPLSSW